MIYSMVRDERPGQMVQFMRVITFQARSKDLVNTVGQMGQYTGGIGMKIR